MGMMILKVGYDTNQSEIGMNIFTQVNEKIIPIKEGGKIMINTYDVYTNEKGSGKDWREITQPMCELLESEGLTYKGCIGMEMAKDRIVEVLVLLNKLNLMKNNTQKKY